MQRSPSRGVPKNMSDFPWTRLNPVLGKKKSIYNYAEFFLRIFLWAFLGILNAR